ncbi:MAG: tetratricopeptide repeat protein [Blastocatellia bacterium]
MKIRDVLIRLKGVRDPKCPNEADILAYYENKVSAATRVQLEQHFATCDDCMEALAFLGREFDAAAAPLAEEEVSVQANRVLAYIRDDERNHRMPAQKAQTARAGSGFYISYPRLAAVGLVISAIAVAAVFWITTDQSPANAAMDVLRTALKDARYTEARVSGGFDHSRYAGVTRGIESNDNDFNLRRAMNKLPGAEEETASADSRLVLARVYLSRGTRDGAKHALAILNQLIARGVETPETLNDLGVAYYQLENYDEAIANFSKALAKSPAYFEALFNRALVEGLTHHDDDARRDWEQFLKESPDDNWNTEARRKLSSLATS